MKTKKRPELNRITVEHALDGIGNGGGHAYVTMSIGQWDHLLATAYQGGWTLLELDDAECPVAAYRREKSRDPA